MALVKGFQVWIKGSDCITIYAKRESGAVLKSSPVLSRSGSFNPKGTTWEAVPEVPQGAEFIGNYPDPVDGN